MASLLRTRKSLLTRRINSFGEWLKESESLLAHPTEIEVSKRVKDIRVGLKICEEGIVTIESSLDKLGEAFEELEEHSAEDDEKFDKYVDSANDMVIKLSTFKTQLLRALEDCTDPSGRGTAEDSNGSVAQAVVSSPLSLSKLPEIPIPNFSGKRWEWDNYWALFLANVHNQELTDLQKYNYLPSSLTGEARQSISRFQVSAANYHKAIDHLMKRYGHKDGIILELHRNLNLCTARGARTIDQRQLFEKLSAIAAQLRDHGEHLDNYLTVHTFLQKFHARIQKAATKRCMKFETSLPHEEPRQAQTQGDSDWTLELWLNTIDNIIAEEERLQDMLAKDKERYISQLPSTKGLLTAACECCKLKGHKWSTCPKIPTPSALTAHMLNPEHQLPIIRPNVEFRRQRDLVVARIPNLPTAEFIVRIKDELHTTTVTSDAVCSVKSTECTGCYNCAKGALAEIICASSTPQERAEIRCGDYGFTVPCSSQGTKSQLRFAPKRAQFHLNCTVQCGRIQQAFEIDGILRYTGVLSTALRRVLSGESEVFSEINFPDISHILDVFLGWSGTLLITALVVFMALLTTYIFLTNTACLFILRSIYRLIKISCRLLYQITRIIICMPARLFHHLHRENMAKPEGKLY
ncbi:hypothetical protein V3C99_015783 [Haemonchus contortus]